MNHFQWKHIHMHIYTHTNTHTYTYRYFLRFQSFEDKSITQSKSVPVHLSTHAIASPCQRTGSEIKSRQRKLLYFDFTKIHPQWSKSHQIGTSSGNGSGPRTAPSHHLNQSGFSFLTHISVSRLLWAKKRNNDMYAIWFRIQRHITLRCRNIESFHKRTSSYSQIPHKQ